MSSAIQLEEVDVLIIGAGPAGLAAALGMARVQRSVAIFDSGVYRNALSHHIHGLPTWDHQNPSDYRAVARRELVDGRYDTIHWPGVGVSNVTKTDEGFKAVDVTGKEWIGKKLVLATGVRDVMLDISGYSDGWGKSIYHCLFCNGFEDSGAESAGLLAVGPMASHLNLLIMASLATRFVKKLVIYTNGSEEVETKWRAMIAQRDDMTTENRKIKHLVNNPSGGISVELDDGVVDSHAFLYHNPTTAPNIDMAKDLGLELSEAGTEVKTSQPFYETNVKGCFAIGDVGSQAKASTLALASGAMVATGLVMQLELGM